jgi:hypothetical protein
MKSRLNKPQNILERALDQSQCDLMDIHKEVYNKWCELCGIKEKCETCNYTTTCECCHVTWPCPTNIITETLWKHFKVLTEDDFS